jgi:ATP-dependent protease ClpP protease subunit
MGEIGWGLYAADLMRQLKDSKGDDLTVRLSSVGGSIFDGADIFNALADHRRANPGITMNLEIKGVAASMASAIASSPAWDSVAVEETSAYMIHNPWSIAIGDYREMASMADFLEKARQAWLGVYAKRSGKSRDEVGEMMNNGDNGTWFYGQEIVDAGFADVVLEAPAQSDDGEMLSGAMVIEKYRTKFREMQAKIKESDTEHFNEKRAAAALRRSRMMQEAGEGDNSPDEDYNGSQERDSTAMKPVPAGEENQEVPMDKDQLRKENPDIYDESVNDGVMSERERVKGLIAMKSQDAYKDIPEVHAVLDKAIEDGTSVSDVTPLVMAAMVKLMNDPGRAQELEGPGDIQTGDAESPAMSGQKIQEV